MRPNATMTRSAVLCVTIVAMMAGCAASPNTTVVSTFQTGQFGKARVALYKELPRKAASSAKPDRNYMLARMRLGVMTLADGLPVAAEPFMNEVFEVLSTAGVNQDKTVASVVINEDVKVWKGEPFEQAITYQYIAAIYASQGSWDNARAAASNALFHLRDFGGGNLDTEAVVTRVGDQELDNYVSVESDFTLGYLMGAVANQQLGRVDQAAEQFAKAVATDPGVAPLVQAFQAGRFNTVLLVDYGRGPEKIGTGPDNAIARFVPRTRSDRRPLLVATNGTTASWPIACDVNVMAQNHQWNNLEDMRIAKSYIGSALVGAGATTMAIGGYNNSDAAVIAGAAMILAGAIAKSTAYADTRYCEALPQRIYLVPVNVTEPNQTLRLSIQGDSGSTMVITGLSPPTTGRAAFRYVRLLSVASPPVWATTGRVVYTNEYEAAPDGLMLPYILGGNDVRKPSYATLADYQRAGYLLDYSLDQLEQLYRDEGIVWDANDAAGYPGLHILEGGKSLVTPLPGTDGYARLFCQQHPPYAPKSPNVARVAAEF